MKMKFIYGWAVTNQMANDLKKKINLVQNKKFHTCVFIIDKILIEPCSPAKAIIGLSPNIPHADV